MTYAVGKGLNKWVEFVIGLAEMFLRVSCSIQELPPHGIQRQSTVQIARVSNTLYPQCLPHHTLPVRWFHSHNSGLFQVDSVPRSSSHAWVEMPFLLSCLLTAPLCSINLCFKFLFVSPTYIFSQSRQDTSYTMLLFNRSGLGVFTRVSFSRSVWWDLKTALTPMRLHTLWIRSDSPWQYGRD